MSEFKQTFNSSLGKKLIMALTGLFLCTFLIVHLGGNLLLFKHDDGFAFNVYANFLTHFPPIEVIAYLLYLCYIGACHLCADTNHQKPQGKAGRLCRYSKSTCYLVSQKTWGLLGSILFLFIVIHMSDFWYRYKYSNSMTYKEYRTDLSSGDNTIDRICTNLS